MDQEKIASLLNSRVLLDKQIKDLEEKAQILKSQLVDQGVCVCMNGISP